MRTEATYNIADDKLRAEFSERLSPEDYERVKAAGFAWWPRQKMFVAKWAPSREDLLHEMGAGDIPIVEMEDDAEARAERFDEYAGNAKARSDAAYQRVADICDRIPLGQPILVGHHSEAGARADQKRIQRGMDKSVEESHKAGYWAERAAAAVRRAERKQRPDVIKRRIDGVEAEQRKCQRSVAEMPSWAGYYQRFVDHLEMVLEYQRGLYEASGGIPADHLEIKVGDLVRNRFGWHEVVRVNRKTVSVKTQYTWTDKIDLSDIRAVEHPA